MGDTNDDLRSLLPLLEDDRALCLGECSLDAGLARGRHRVVVALHRGTGTFCHVYLIPRVKRGGRLEVRLAAVFEGAAWSEAERFARSLVDRPEREAVADIAA